MEPTGALTGRVISCVGGLYTVETGDGTPYSCYAKGVFRHEDIVPLAGDYVEFDGGVPGGGTGREDIGYIRNVLQRKNYLIRPPVANVDRLFLVFSLVSPPTTLLAIDKLTALAAHNGIDAALVFTKTDIAPPDTAETLVRIYTNSRFKAVSLCARDPKETAEKLASLIQGVTSVFTGPSGTGKSTLINTLYPELGAHSGEVSRKNLRGKHTTRQSRLYRIDENGTYLADTPGFTLLDFERFFFMRKEDLVFSFPEYRDYVGSCKYTKCTHTKEEGCGIVEAVRRGELEPTRHASYLSLYEDLKKHKDWQT